VTLPADTPRFATRSTAREKNSRNQQKSLFDLIRGPDVLPVLSREVVEGQQLVAVFHQLAHGLLVFHAVGFDEEIEGGSCLLLGLSHPDVLQIHLRLFVQGFGHGTQNVRRLVDPASLLARVGKDLAQCRPEPKRAVADSQFRGHRQAALLQSLQQVAPAVRVLAEPVRDRQDILLAVFVSADNHQHTLAIAVQAGCEVDPIRPDVDIALGLQIALAPGLVLVPPGRLQARDGRRRQPLGIRSQKRRQRLTEVAGRDTLQVKPGQKFLDRLGLAQIGRDQRRSEPDLASVRIGPAITDARNLNGDRPDPGHHLTLRQKAVAHQTLASFFVQQMRVLSNEGGNLGLNSRTQQLLGTRLDHLGQRIR